MNVTDRKEPESVIISSNECNRTVLRVVVTDATTEIALALAYRIFCDNVFGPNQPIFLVLFECRDKAKFLESVAIELTDYAPDLLQGISYTDEASVAFKDVDIVFSIGRARGYEFTEEEYTELFFKEFVLVAKFYGQAIERYAKRNVKVIVLGNTAATIISRYATSIPPQNITALSKFNLKMSAAHIAARVKCHPTEIKNIIIWGTNNKHTFPDCRYISFKNGKTLNTELNVWLRSDLPSCGFVPLEITRNTYLDSDTYTANTNSFGSISLLLHIYKIIQGITNRSWYTRSFAYSLADHCKVLRNGTPEGEWTCMGVLSDNSYDVPSGIFFSFPVRCKNGEYEIVKDLVDDSYVQRHIENLSEIVTTEINTALAYCGSK